MTDVKRYIYDPAELRSLSASIEELHTRPSNSITPGVWYLRTRYVTRALPEAAEQIEALTAQLAEAERMEGQAHERVRELEAEKGRVNPPFDVALPKITAEILESYKGFGFIRTSDEGYDWTTEAIDFAAEIVRPAVRARIAQLEEGYPGIAHDFETANIRIAALEQQVADLNLQLAGANARADMADSRVQQLESANMQERTDHRTLQIQRNFDLDSITQLEAALRWYADDNTGIVEYIDDKGDRARQALGGR